MQIHRCDQCGVESPDHVRMYQRATERWWNFGQEYRNQFHLCSWECVVEFVGKHSSRPQALLEAKEPQYYWNAKTQEYEKIKADTPAKTNATQRRSHKH